MRLRKWTEIVVSITGLGGFLYSKSKWLVDAVGVVHLPNDLRELLMRASEVPTGVAYSLLIIGVVGVVFLIYDTFFGQTSTGKRLVREGRMIPAIGMSVFGAGFIACMIWFIFQKPGRVATPTVQTAAPDAVQNSQPALGPEKETKELVGKARFLFDAQTHQFSELDHDGIETIVIEPSNLSSSIDVNRDLKFYFSVHNKGPYIIDIRSSAEGNNSLYCDCNVAVNEAQFVRISVRMMFFMIMTQEINVSFCRKVS